MGTFKDLTGQRFGRLTVLRRAESRNKHTMWLCKCDCGTVKEVFGSALVSGLSTSCGCYRVDWGKEHHTKHGHHGDRLYRVWKNMKQRCFNPSPKDKKYYAGSGVKVCDEWLHDYGAFREWAYANGYDENAQYFECTIDRINPYGDYEPCNCRWVNNYVQQNNKKRDWKGNKYVGKLNTL